MRRLDLTFTALRVPLDAVSFIAAAVTAYALRVSPAFLEIRPILQAIPVSTYIASVGIFLLVWLFCFWLAGLYQTHQRPFWSEVGRIILANTAGITVVIATVFFRREVAASRFLVLASWGIAIVYAIIARGLLRSIRYLLLKNGVGHLKLAIIGQGAAAKSLEQLYRQQTALGYTLVKTYKTWSEATKKDLIALQERNVVDALLLAEPDVSKEHALDLIAFAEERHLTFRYLADLFAARFTRIDVTTEAGIPIIEPKRTPLDGWGRIAKRIFDLIVSSVFIIVTSPIMLITAIAIKLDSEGTVFFSRLPNGEPVQRMGEKGKPFHYFKFRSMKKDQHFMRYKELADLNMRVDGPLVKTKNDPRITRVGRFIRKWSLDELSEFFHVFLGHMSVVGPRPHFPEEVAKYKPEQRGVLAIKPGITGMAQVSGREDLSFDEEVRLDTWYIEHWSLWLDVLILLKTPLAILNHRSVEEGT